MLHIYIYIFMCVWKYMRHTYIYIYTIIRHKCIHANLISQFRPIISEEKYHIYIYIHTYGENFVSTLESFSSTLRLFEGFFSYIYTFNHIYIYIHCSIMWCTHKHTKIIIQRVPLSLPPDSRYNKLPNAATEICKGRFGVRSMSTKTPLFCQATCLHGWERKGYPSSQWEVVCQVNFWVFLKTMIQQKIE